MLFGAVYSLQLVVDIVDVYINFPDLFEDTGAAEFLKSLHDRPVRHYDNFWENYKSYQLVIWTDHYGWEFEERRMKGPKGGVEFFMGLEFHVALSVLKACGLC